MRCPAILPMNIQRTNASSNCKIPPNIPQPKTKARIRAKNNNALQDIYNQIDKLERSEVEIDSFKRYSEHFFLFALAGIALLFLEILLRYTWLRRFP